MNVDKNLKCIASRAAGQVHDGLTGANGNAVSVSYSSTTGPVLVVGSSIGSIYANNIFPL